MAEAFPPVDDGETDGRVGGLVAEKDEAGVGFFAEGGRIAVAEKAEVEDVGADIVVIPQGVVDDAFKGIYRDHSTIPCFFFLAR